MINWFPILWPGFVLTILVVSLVVVPYLGKQRIRAYLTASGAQNVTVSYQWFGSDRYYNTYDVTYTDAAGHSYSTTCVMTGAFWGGKRIYWLDGPRGTARMVDADYQLSGAALPKRGIPTGNKLTATPALTQEQRISKLMAENQQLRLELQRLQAKQGAER